MHKYQVGCSYICKKIRLWQKNVVSFAVANDKWDYSPDVQVVSFKSQS